MPEHINLIAQIAKTNFQLVQQTLPTVKCFCQRCEPDDVYECDECHRIVPYCSGAADDYYEFCDDCAVNKMNAKGELED